MPKLSKIRLTGCKYEGFNKEHENSIFDLTRDGSPDHSLFTLCNGGGKGVMMQLIFQVLIPGTKWGNNDGNKVISMFYDRRNNLIPYTFHVVLEWVLDTIPEKRLITGIAVKPVMKHSSSEEEDKAGLSYFLYTYEHDNNGYYNMENLPIYDKTKGESVDMDVFEDFINNNKRDFIKYSMSSARRRDGEYYRYLESRGIYRPEWNILKTINKSEGGVGDYFIGASDNKSIFDKVIIPAISENIRNYAHGDENNLIEMFRSNLSITRDLPILIKRESYYKELLVEIEPLIQNADSGSRFIDLKNRIINEGDDIYFILKDEERIAEKDIEKWRDSLNKAKDEKKELNYRKDNLNYNKDKRELDLKLEESEILNIKLEEGSQAINEGKKELILYKINRVLSSKKLMENRIKTKLEEKERLIKTLDIEDIEVKAEELEDEIQGEWDRVKSIWNNSENQYIGYMNYSKEIIEENLRKKKTYEIRRDGLQNEVNLFQIREENLGEEKDGLREYYDDMTLAFPERILEDLLKSKEEKEKALELMASDISNMENRIGDIRSNKNKLEYSHENIKDQLTSLEIEIVEREKYELDLARRLTNQLLEDYNGQLLNHNWFLNKLEKLETIKKDKKENLDRVQRIIWEKNIDKSLNREDYFIPNKDILLIKSAIEGIEIHVETGTEYLRALDPKDRDLIVQDYPGFIYSLVIGTTRDWELIQKNIGRELFLNNMVPIYIRAEMEKGKNIFKTILGRANDLVEDEAYSNWKDNLDKEFRELCKTRDNLNGDMDDIDNLLQELKVIEGRDTVYILNQRLRALEKETMEIEEALRLNREELLNLDNRLKSIESKVDQLKKTLNKNLEIMVQVEKYMESLKRLEEERIIILKRQEDLDNIRDDIRIIEEENEEWRFKQDEIRELYNKWKVNTESLIKTLQVFLRDGNFDFKIEKDYVNFNIPDFNMNSDLLVSLIDERRIIEEDIKSKNTNIAVIDSEIRHFTENLEGYIRELEKLDRDWKAYSDLMIPENEINMIIDEIEKRNKSLEEENLKIRSQFDRIQGSIGVMTRTIEDREKQILKFHGRGVTILEIENYPSAINLVERDIKSNSTYLALCEDELSKNEKNKSKLEINLLKMNSGYDLDLTKGKMDGGLKNRIKDNPDLTVEDWLSRCEKSKSEIRKTVDEGSRLKNRFIKNIENNLEEDKLKDRIISVVKESNIENFKNNISSFESMKNHFQQELLRLSKDKEKAESSMNQWVNRASIYVIRMIGALKDMVASMNYVNEQDHIFPLVKLKGIEKLPREESEIAYLLEEYFVQTIEEVLKTNEDIDNVDDRVFNKLMGDNMIFSKALQGRYPTLMVYKMSEKNEFKFAKARDEYYTSWEAINKGEGDLPEGSGGQTLSVNTFVIMMIMSFKKKHIGNENPSTILILDNPFGKASAKHILDPIFEIADKLNFQLICFAAPEIIKMEISERFPVFWELKIEDRKIVHGGRIIK